MSVPFWLVTFVASLRPIRDLRNYRARRQGHGVARCPSCGYLRAGTERCPECGANAVS